MAKDLFTGNNGIILAQNAQNSDTSPQKADDANGNAVTDNFRPTYRAHEGFGDYTSIADYFTHIQAFMSLEQFQALSLSEVQSLLGSQLPFFAIRNHFINEAENTQALPITSFKGGPLDFNYTYVSGTALQTPANVGFNMANNNLLNGDPALISIAPGVSELTFFRGSLNEITYTLVLGDDTNNFNLHANPSLTEALLGSKDQNNLILGFDGTDQLAGDGSSNSNTLTTGNDILMGGEGGDTIYGDFITNFGTVTTAGNDILIGDKGNDNLTGDVGSNAGTITTAGDDTLKGGAGNDQLAGDVSFMNVGTLTTAGSDTLIGGEGNDTLTGDVTVNFSTITLRNAGDDILMGGAGNDILA